MNRNHVSVIVLSIALFVAAVSGCTGQSKPPVNTPNAHGEHGTHGSEMATEPAMQLIVSSTPQKPRAGDAVKLRMMLHDAEGRMLKEFEPTHTKLAHLIIVREGLDEFAHLHPTVEKTGDMMATHTFPVGGRYLVFLDYTPVGKAAGTSRATLVVEGDSPAAPALEPNVPGTIAGDGLQAEVAMRPSEEKAQIVTFKVRDESGASVNDLQTYLGAMGHLVVLSADGGQYVHAHPLTETAPDGKVEFEVHFPGPGTYKGWGQFQRGDRVFTIPAVVKVEAGAHH